MRYITLLHKNPVDGTKKEHILNIEHIIFFSETQIGVVAGTPHFKVEFNCIKVGEEEKEVKKLKDLKEFLNMHGTFTEV